RHRGRAGGHGRGAPRPRLGAEAGPARHRGERGRPTAGAPGADRAGGRHDGGQRRARGRDPPRRRLGGGRAARPRGGRRLSGARGGDAVTSYLLVADEVREALAAGRPVVALETTLAAHGFPAPTGAEVAEASEAAVRAAGAVPATVGVL